MTPKQQPAFYVLVEYRLRRFAIGAFITEQEANDYLRDMPNPRGWHVVGVEQPVLTPEQLMNRLVRSGYDAGTGPFEDEPPCAECGEPLVVGDGPDHVFCDLCGKAEHPADLTPDWNGETGCHLSCEEARRV